MNENQEKVILLTVKEAAGLVSGMSEYTVRRLLKEGLFPHIKNGRKIYIPQDAFLEAMRGNTISTSDTETPLEN